MPVTHSRLGSHQRQNENFPEVLPVIKHMRKPETDAARHLERIRKPETNAKVAVALA